MTTYDLGRRRGERPQRPAEPVWPWALLALLVLLVLGATVALLAGWVTVQLS